MTTDITELAQRMKAAAEKATPGPWERGDGKHGGELLVYCDDALGSAVCEATSEYNAIPKYQRIDNLDFIAMANPANILALVEALEKVQQVDEELCKLLPPGAEYMDHPDGGDVTPLEGVRRMVADYRQRIAELESRTVKLPDELSGETLLDVASRTDLVYSDGTGILEYMNINGCFVKVTAPPDKVIRFRCSNKRIYMRLVDRVKTHENAGIIIDFHKNNKDFIQ
ncbi:hypothetical protein CI612_17350 [Klebsiella quasipneumoniae subsp. similipneumoniae]|uniref:ead/Ea22-like family protein n=1 Tax=Klebsiella quasipneumoniae TaxID=1463165 RepID=UPI000B953553|nr:ead/Ea22-like family protein [Klebsiella quasipneumoniae]OYF78674.1 hypothetical protein CI612_17350 [Klebsiella quasipneumoniae subsp. similipneumoniae]